MKFLLKSSLFFGLVLFATSLYAQSDAIAAIPSSPYFTPKSDVVLYAPVSFPGGEEVLLQKVQNNLEYPDLAQNYGIEGMVVVRLSVDRDGLITDQQILSSLGYGCDEAAIVALQQLPKWQPALRNGQPVASIVNVPLRFRLR